MKTTLVVATRNAHKTEEIRALVGDRFEAVEDLGAHSEIPSPEESGDTFLENADIKAVEASRRLPGATVLADDSGLEVDVLGKEPGVHSARYAGEDADDAANRRKLLDALDELGERGESPTARFRCVLSLAAQGKVVANYEGAVEGTICAEERGEGGFGYDPLFVPEGREQTFAELSSEEKNAMSHRGRALAKWLEDL